MSRDADMAAEHARIAEELREEARTLLIETGLLEFLQSRFGDVTVTGSAGYDLMVWRQLDLHVACDYDRLGEWLNLAAEFAKLFDSRGLTLESAHFHNGYAAPAALGTGLYWGLGFNDFAGSPWKIEIWAWEPFDHAVRQARDANLRADLSTADRDLILALKHEVRARDAELGGLISSFDIYEFVIAGAGTTLDEVLEWKGLA